MIQSPLDNPKWMKLTEEQFFESFSVLFADIKTDYKM